MSCLLGDGEEADVDPRPTHFRPELFGISDAFWQTSVDLMVVMGPHGALLATNPSCREYVGLADERPSFTLTRLVAAMMRKKSANRFDAVEFRMRTGAGEYRRISWSGTFDGRHWYATGRDVTTRHETEVAAQEAAELWHAASDSLSGEMSIIDDRGQLVAVNQAWRDFGRRGGRGQTSHLDENYLDVCARAGDEPGALQASEAIRALIAGRREPCVFDYALGDRWYTFVGTTFSDAGPTRVVIVHTDVTERRRLEQEARAQTEAFEALGISLVEMDADLKITRWNRGAQLLHGWSADEAIGRDARDMVVAQPAEDATGEPSGAGLFEVINKDGSTRHGQVRWTEMRGADDRPAGILAVGIDVSAQHRAEEAAKALRDELLAVTDSMKEGLLVLAVNGAVSHMNRAAESMLGWPLREVRGHHIHAVLSHEDAETPHAQEDCPLSAVARTQQLLEVDSDSFACRDGSQLDVSYTVTPVEQDDDLRGSVVVFMDATHVRAEQQRLLNELEDLVWIQRVQGALETDSLLLYAQPIIDLTSGAVIQHELLLRVRQPDGVIVTPEKYLATAEQHGLIGKIDRWVVQRALAYAATGTPLEVNVSAISLNSPAFLDDIEMWIAESKVDPSLVVFEITETALISDQQAARHFVQRIHDFGCRVALDDFGTGFGGFTYLKSLPVDILKIDIEFVTDICHNPASRHVVSAIVDLARRFGLHTVAEGVEDEQTLRLVTELGVDCAQGYHLGRPAIFNPLPTHA